MSKYTTEVRFLCESEAGLINSEGFNSIATVLTEAAPKIFNFDFPIFDETYRTPLEVKILRHYYTREICEETVGLWKLRLQDKLNMIMPYYNQLYASELLRFNPLYDIDYQSVHNKANYGEQVASENHMSRSNESDTHNEFTNDNTDTNESKSKSKINTVSKNVEENNSNVESVNSESVGNATNTNTNTNTSNNTSNKTSTNTSNNISNTTSTNTSDNTSNKTSTNTSNKTSNDSTENRSGSNSSSQNNKTANRTDKYSDTPQGSISNLENDTYLTNARLIGDTESNVTTAQDSTTGTASSSSNESITNTGIDKDSSSNYQTSVGEDSSSNYQSESSISENNATNKKTDNTHENETESDTNTINKNSTIDTTGDRNVNRETNANSNKTHNVSNTEDYIEHVFGKRYPGSSSKLLKEFRETFLNIDKMIIEELSTLFFGLWE